LLPSYGFNGYYTTAIGGKGEPTRGDMIALGVEVGLQKKWAENMVEEIVEKSGSILSMER